MGIADSDPLFMYLKVVRAKQSRVAAVQIVAGNLSSPKICYNQQHTTKKWNSFIKITKTGDKT